MGDGDVLTSPRAAAAPGGTWVVAGAVAGEVGELVAPTPEGAATGAVAGCGRGAPTRATTVPARSSPTRSPMLRRSRRMRR
ncbi:MAG: hypothetical protein IPO89_06270 [Actinomycetales bacterium]|nr:hypothetical protein [Candidatus Lutibacillus vidarii]